MAIEATVQEASSEPKTRQWAGAAYVLYDTHVADQLPRLRAEFPTATLIPLESPHVKLCEMLGARHIGARHIGGAIQNDGDIVIVAHSACPDLARKFDRPRKRFLAFQTRSHLAQAARVVAGHVGTACGEPVIWGVILDDDGRINHQITRAPQPHRRLLANVIAPPMHREPALV
jgi:hypothetical protein